MVVASYSGNAIRSAHYSVRPSVPGVNKDHFTPDPEPDPFNPVPDTPPNQEGTVLADDGSDDPGQSNYPNLASVPVTHWYGGSAPVPSSVPYGRAQQEMQDRIIADHSVVHYVPDEFRLYQHYSQGQANQFITGRMPQNAGEDPGERLQYLVNGTNSYDHTNQPNEVYTGDAPNVGRYRLGVKTNIFGLYENPLGKFGQDAWLRAYTGLTPALPRAKEQMKNTAPYTPNSQGTAHWFPSSFAQIPSLFSSPSETAVTDYSTVNAGEEYKSDFTDRGGRL